MSACLYLEGGGSGPNSKGLDISCQRAFHKLLDRMVFSGRKPRLIACGGRGAVFDRFKTAVRAAGRDYIAMWIDSEEPMSDIDAAWRHLGSITTVPSWTKPEGVEDEQVLFMTTCMETWIIADRATLRRYYGGELAEGRLPSLVNFEGRDRHAVQEALIRATERCRNSYKKGERSFAVLAEIDPAALEQLPSFARVRRILKEKLG